MRLKFKFESELPPAPTKYPGSGSETRVSNLKTFEILGKLANINKLLIKTNLYWTVHIIQ